jgi:hypothetical protein
MVRVEGNASFDKRKFGDQVARFAEEYQAFAMPISQWRTSEIFRLQVLQEQRFTSAVIRFLFVSQRDDAHNTGTSLPPSRHCGLSCYLCARPHCG